MSDLKKDALEYHKLGGKPAASAADLEAGLDELAGLCAGSHVALLCAEADPAR